MGQFWNSFIGRAGRNTADFASNLIFGDKWARPYKRISDEARANVYNAKASEYEARAARCERDYVNSVDAAVLNNVDAVIADEFTDNPNEIVRHLMNLFVQVKTNSFKARTEEEKVRTKYTKAVLAKIEQGINLLEYIDPQNPRLNYFTWQYIKTKKRELLSLRFVRTDGQTAIWLSLIMIIVFVVIPFILIDTSENNAWDELGEITLQVLLCIIALVLAFQALKLLIMLVFYLYHKIKRRRYIMYGIMEPTYKQTDVIQAEDKPRQETKIETPQQTKEKTVPANFKYGQLIGDLCRRHCQRNEILKRGASYCENLYQRDILIVGFNPMDNGETNLCTSFTIPQTNVGYWGAVNKIILGHTDKATYIDLFTYRENDLGKGLKSIISNHRLIDYVVEQVSITQEIIEDIIQPKVIVILNQEAWAFFGRVPGLTWMGYNFSSITTCKGYDVCYIRGFSNATDRIAQDTRKMTNLSNTIVIFAKMDNPRNLPSYKDLESYLKL